MVSSKTRRHAFAYDEYDELTFPPDCHPSRQGNFPEGSYRTRHDIYSLGVLLLELGLWESFITYSNLATSSSSLTTPDSSSENGTRKQAELDPTIPVLPSFVTKHASEKDFSKRATAIKAHLVSLASQKLPAKMGQKYADVVLSCLQCLDSPPNFARTEEGEEGNDSTGWESGDVYDVDGTVIDVEYTERILSKMQEIRV